MGAEAAYDRRVISRRSLLAAAGLALAGCATEGGRAATPSPSATSSPTPRDSATPSPATSPTPSPTPSAAPQPSRAELVAKYAGRSPVEWGLKVTGMVVGTTPAAARAGKVALTFDACGGPHGSGYDAALIAALRKLKVRATLMLNQRWVEANRSLAAELAADPLFEIQSHGSVHLPLSVAGRAAYGIPGTTSVAGVYDELTSANATLTALTGKPVRFYRPGTAYADDIAAAMAVDLATPLIGFTVNADGGATFSPAQVAGELARVRGGDVVIAHMNQPTGGTAAGFAQALPRLLDAGVGFGTLSEVCA